MWGIVMPQSYFIGSSLFLTPLNVFSHVFLFICIISLGVLMHILYSHKHIFCISNPIPALCHEFMTLIANNPLYFSTKSHRYFNSTCLKFFSYTPKYSRLRLLLKKPRNHHRFFPFLHAFEWSSFIISVSWILPKSIISSVALSPQTIITSYLDFYKRLLPSFSDPGSFCLHVSYSTSLNSCTHHSYYYYFHSYFINHKYDIIF